ncbi:MAG: hypothetical protein PHW77_02525, partial [Eubacteriales bacterium]|nr:hypothetical protein [Eubacteriales bacterium]
MAMKFQGGIKLSEYRNTKKLPITFIDRPSVITLGLDNGHCSLVSAGDYVKKYEKIVLDEDGFTVSSPITGKVLAAEQKYIIIENSYQPEIAPPDDEKPSTIEEITFEKLINYSKKYGVTGTFSGIPLHKKLTEAYGKCERLIVSCVESDPSSGHVRAMVRLHARELVLGIKIILRAMGIKKAVMALDKKYGEDYDAIKKHAEEKSGIVPAFISIKYPVGCERLLLNAIYNTEFSSDTEVWRIGYPVLSAETVINLYLALRDG